MKRLANNTLESIEDTFYSILDVVADKQGRHKNYLIFVSWLTSLVTVLIALPLIILSALIVYPFYVGYKMIKGETWYRF